MLKEIYIENYKSLKNAKIEFKDGLNIIIGKNGSGKSNLLEFLSKVIGTDIFFNKTDFHKQKFPENNFSYVFYYNGNLDNQIELVVKLPANGSTNGAIGKTIFISQKDINGRLLNQQTIFSDGNINKLNNPVQISNGSLSVGINEFSSVILILRMVNGFANKYLGYNMPNDIPWLDNPTDITINTFIGNILENVDNYNYLFSYGFQDFLQNKLIDNLLDTADENILDTIKTFFFDSFNEYKENTAIERLLSSFTPIEDIRISNNVNIYKLPDKILIDNLTFDFKIDGNWMPWSNLSDGTKRLFYLASEINSCNNGVVLIEEPELGIHPHQLYKLMQFIREESETKQIIVSTHSPIVLDALDPDELDRITIAKIEDGASRFYKLTDEQKKKGGLYMKEVGELSYYWLHSDLEDND